MARLAMKPRIISSDLVRQHAGSVFAFQHGKIFVTVIDDLSLHGRVVGAQQACDFFAALEVRGHDFGHVGRRQLGVPVALGIDDHDGAAVAYSQTAAAGDLHFLGQTFLAEFAMQCSQNRKRTCGGAAGNSFRLFLSANECVIAIRPHKNLQGSG